MSGFNPAFQWMDSGEKGGGAAKASNRNVSKFTTTTADNKGVYSRSSNDDDDDGSGGAQQGGFGRRPSFNSGGSKPPPPRDPPPPPSGSSASSSKPFDFLSEQDKLQQDLTAMTMKNKTVRATTQARKNLAQKERASQRKVIDEKVAHARKQLEEDEDQWFRFLMEQREREVREAEERQRKNAERQKQSAEKTPEQRAEEARARQERDAERRRNPVDAAMTQGQSGQWNEYETKWASFVELEVIPMASIPWPPHSEKLLQWATQKQPESQNYKAKVKSAYKHCALRWHPDKFMGKYGSKLKEGERDAIQSRLNENFQILNASFTAALKGA